MWSYELTVGYYIHIYIYVRTYYSRNSDEFFTHGIKPHPVLAGSLLCTKNQYVHVTITVCELRIISLTCMYKSNLFHRVISHDYYVHLNAITMLCIMNSSCKLEYDSYAQVIV